MSELHTIRLEVSNGSLDTLAVEVPNTSPWKLLASGAGFRSREFVGEDLFEALIALRKELEKTGYRLLCAGARVDVFPSGMSRSMGGGRKAYITQLGEPATDTIDIFAEAEPGAVGTVEQQKEFHTKWIRSLMKSR